ncbi:bifunctional 2-polyprenyl-6-hydroxyphenol methylase/3-demethylubiquinol 3-O-methyltransferase UbiG [Leptotrichia sp. oral taxon 223]|uniref:class I SAM-dependent methyltransferase n=1 Tax=Leptotrichia sp. oral taxon 223 TaxID=712363 RepID=UPI0015B988D2|nr:class I SAM-dependent methyltransferase [Leptotrichia sp. oral taxon 223]NWO18600.1 class I SAM-dependent methyltransferase [Leptotrichia sp. oral taxon 223]
MHKEFAEIYDIFMKYVNYDEWYKFLRMFIKNKGTVLDLGCGTGEFIWRFLRDEFSVVGVDLSEKMLEISEKKLLKRNLVHNYKLVKENIVHYDNVSKNNEIQQVDYIICNFDTVNYLKNEKEFLKFIEKCNQNLKKDGYLIFDAVTEDIFEEIFENDVFLDEEPEYTSIWRHEQLSERKHLVEIDLFIRENESDNLFRKYNEVQYKFIYEPEWIVETVQNNGFEVFDTASNPEFGESRIFFVLKKL